MAAAILQLLIAAALTRCIAAAFTDDLKRRKMLWQSLSSSAHPQPVFPQPSVDFELSEAGGARSSTPSPELGESVPKTRGGRRLVSHSARARRLAPDDQPPPVPQLNCRGSGSTNTINRAYAVSRHEDSSVGGMDSISSRSLEEEDSTNFPNFRLSLHSVRAMSDAACQTPPESERSFDVSTEPLVFGRVNSNSASDSTTDHEFEGGGRQSLIVSVPPHRDANMQYDSAGGSKKCFQVI